MGQILGSPADSGELPERRSEDRTITVFRPILIATKGFTGFCLVRNLSSGGLMGKVYMQFSEGLAVVLRFTEDVAVSGSVAWSRDGHIGVRFDEPVDIDRLLDELGKKKVGNKIARAPRLEIRFPGELLVDGEIHPVEAHNISQRGLKVELSCFVAPDREVLVRLNGLGPRKAIVRWTRFEMAGVSFIRPLGFDELAEWVVGLQTGRSDAARHDWQAKALARWCEAIAGCAAPEPVLQPHLLKEGEP